MVFTTNSSDLISDSSDSMQAIVFFTFQKFHANTDENFKFSSQFTQALDNRRITHVYETVC